MAISFVLLNCKTKLQEVDFNQRLKLIYNWTKTGYIKQGEFVTLINFSVDLDLLPIED
jgi:hypothetical protein